MPPLLHLAALLAPLAFAPQDAPAPPEGTTPVRVPPEEAARRLESLYEGTLVGVKDGSDFEETPAYRRLLEILGGYREDELRAKNPRTFDRAAVSADPDAWRGELVRIHGLVATGGL